MNRRSFLSIASTAFVFAVAAPVLARIARPKLVQRKRLDAVTQQVTFIAKNSDGFHGPIQLRTSGNAIWLHTMAEIACDGVVDIVQLRRNLPKGHAIKLPVKAGTRKITFDVICLPLAQATTLLELRDI